MLSSQPKNLILPPLLTPILLLLLLISGCSLFQPTRPYDPSKPNIILILTDDQPQDTIAFMPTLQTELVEKGINFTNAYVTTPLCCPSRASILNGQYAHNHDVLTNRPPVGGAGNLDDSSTIATWLQAAGYTTGFIGKYLNAYGQVEPYGYIPPGWDDWRVFIDSGQPYRYYYDYTLNENGQLVEYGAEEEDYGTDVLVSKAVDFIRASAEEPFFLFLSFYAPHQPRAAAERHEDLFRTEQQIRARRPLNFNERDMTDKPEYMQSLAPADTDRMDLVYQRALRSLMAVDEGIAEILGALQQIKQKENTVIIYLSDNGEAWGEHRLSSAKNCPYEECIRVPFVVYYPDAISQPRADNSLVLNIDLAATIVDIAGLNIPASIDGLSFLPLLRDPAASWRESFIIEHWRTEEGFGSLVPDFVGIRTEQWKYVRYETGEIELYDLVNGPFEMDNLAYLDEYQERVLLLDAELDEMLGE